jgi:hypothetical protein
VLRSCYDDRVRVLRDNYPRDYVIPVKFAIKFGRWFIVPGKDVIGRIVLGICLDNSMRILLIFCARLRVGLVLFVGGFVIVGLVGRRRSRLDMNLG